MKHEIGRQDMNELKPRVQLHAPASLRRNVMERIDEGNRRGRGSAVWRWYAAAAVAAIGLMTFALWQHPTEKQYAAQQDNPVSFEPREVSKPVAEVVPQTLPTKVIGTERHKIHSKRKAHSRSYSQSYVPEKSKAGDEKPITGSEDEIIVVGWGKPLPVTGAVQQGEEDVAHNPIDYEKYTPEEQRLIDQVNQHRDIVYARLADELEQASLRQSRLRQEVYNNWQQVRQILLRVYPKGEMEKAEKPVQTI